jgi:hypothetical protein
LLFSEIKSFALINLKYSEKRGLYFLNIFLKNNFLYENKDLINLILEENKEEGLEKKILKYLF